MPDAIDASLMQAATPVTRRDDVDAGPGIEDAQDAARAMPAGDPTAGWRATDILEVIDDAFCALDQDWRIIYVNRRAEELWSRRRRDLVGHDFRARFPSVPGTELHRVLLQVAADRRPARIETPSPVTGRWIDVSVLPTDPDGLALCFRDVDDRRRAEEALREGRERLGALFEQATVGIVEADLEGRIVVANRRYAEILGHASPAEVVGRSVWTLAHPHDMARSQANFLRLVAEGSPTTLEKRYLTPAGTEVWAQIDAAVTRDAAGRPRSVMAVVQDVTERRRDERRLRTLVGELNHRVKNTLATVQAIVTQTLAGSGSDLPRFARDLLGRLRILARAHDLLIDDRWAPADLGAVIRAALAPWLEIGGDDRRLRLTCDCVDSETAAVSPRQAQALVLALHELATNAAKHGALSIPAGRVELRCAIASDGGSAEIGWTESDGPPVPGPPTRRGFGTRLLERGLAHDLGPGASVRLRFEPAGLRASIRFAPVKA